MKRRRVHKPRKQRQENPIPDRNARSNSAPNGTREKVATILESTNAPSPAKADARRLESTASLPSHSNEIKA
jgi:hypothetical protein